MGARVGGRVGRGVTGARCVCDNASKVDRIKKVAARTNEIETVTHDDLVVPTVSLLKKTRKQQQQQQQTLRG